MRTGDTLNNLREVSCRVVWRQEAERRAGGWADRSTSPSNSRPGDQPTTGATFSLLPPDNATGNFTKVVQRVRFAFVSLAFKKKTSIVCNQDCRQKLKFEFISTGILSAR